MGDMERQCRGALSRLVIYRKQDALELEKIEMENAVIKAVLLHKSIPGKNWFERFW